MSRTVRGTKKDAQRLAAEMTVRAPTASVARVSVFEMLDLWAENTKATWAPSTEVNQLSRIRLVKTDRISSISLTRLTAVDVDQWHARLERKGLGEAGIRNRHLVLRAAMTLAVRLGWVPTNVVATARLGRRKSQPRGTLSDNEVRAVLTSASSLVASGQIEPQASIALRLAAMTGARRSELAALRWEDLHAGRLVIDSSIAILRSGDGSRKPTLRDDPTKTANRRVVSLDAASIVLLASLKAEFGAGSPWIVSPRSEPVNPERVTASSSRPCRRGREVAIARLAALVGDHVDSGGSRHQISGQSPGPREPVDDVANVRSRGGSGRRTHCPDTQSRY